MKLPIATATQLLRQTYTAMHIEINLCGHVCLLPGLWEVVISSQSHGLQHHDGLELAESRWGTSYLWIGCSVAMDRPTPL